MEKAGPLGCLITARPPLATLAGGLQFRVAALSTPQRQGSHRGSQHAFVVVPCGGFDATPESSMQRDGPGLGRLHRLHRPRRLQRLQRLHAPHAAQLWMDALRLATDHTAEGLQRFRHDDFLKGFSASGLGQDPARPWAGTARWKGDRSWRAGRAPKTCQKGFPAQGLELAARKAKANACCRRGMQNPVFKQLIEKQGPGQTPLASDGFHLHSLRPSCLPAVMRCSIVRKASNWGR